MNPKLTILIPTLEDRKEFLARLMRILEPQCDSENVKIIQYCDNRELSIGKKRNELVNACKTEYASFIDDDDVVSSDYCKLVMEGINKNVDVVSFKGIITGMHNRRSQIFIHRLGYEWKTVGNVYLRPPNHLNPMRTEVFRQFPFKDVSFAEDSDFSGRVQKAGNLKTEHYIDKEIYYYNFRPETMKRADAAKSTLK